MTQVDLRSLKDRLAERFRRLLATTWWFPLVISLLVFEVVYEVIKVVRWWFVF